MNTQHHFQLILASRSERREQLLQQIGITPLCLPVDIDEAALPGEQPVELVERLARSKACACRDVIKTHNGISRASDRLQAFDVAGVADDGVRGVPEIEHCVLLAADTVIDLDGQVIGKPVNRDDCLQTLSALSGRTHIVHSGVCVLPVASNRCFTRVVSTEVTFGRINARQAQHYWDTGEPRDKAGSYAVQGLGALFVVRLNGSYSAVVGLPLHETAALLNDAGFPMVPVISEAEINTER